MIWVQFFVWWVTAVLSISRSYWFISIIVILLFRMTVTIDLRIILMNGICLLKNINFIIMAFYLIVFLALHCFIQKLWSILLCDRINLKIGFKSRKESMLVTLQFKWWFWLISRYLMAYAEVIAVDLIALRLVLLHVFN